MKLLSQKDLLPGLPDRYLIAHHMGTNCYPYYSGTSLDTHKKLQDYYHNHPEPVLEEVESIVGKLWTHFQCLDCSAQVPKAVELRNLPRNYLCLSCIESYAKAATNPTSEKSDEPYLFL